MAKSRKAYSDASRQQFKGKPGYDKNGFPIGEWFTKVTTNKKK